jgi:adenylate cyclase
MLSAGENLLTRTENADMLMVVDYDYRMVADTLRIYPPETEFPWPYLLEDAEDDADYETSSFILIQGIAYYVVAVPILTPLVDGWILVGQRLDGVYVDSLKDIISSDVSIIQIAGSGTGRLVATTLPDQQAGELASEFNLYFAGQNTSGMLDLAGEAYVSLSSTLVARPELNLIALIQQSLPEALAPYRELEQRLIVLFALGLCLSALMAMFLGRSVSKPVMSLVSRVGRIEQGDYSASAPSRRSDEIGRLENSVNTMATGLAEKEKVRDLLGKVVSREIAEELMRGEVKLGGEMRTATILFSDIRDFTSLCEGRPPETILEMLNHYLSEVSIAIEDNKGVVDKYIGDAVMALFGAPVGSPQDVHNALSAALAMKSRVDAVNAANRVSGMPLLKTGIGLHTGEVVAGNLGSANRMNYTVIGDAVNLASRLEALTKQYGAGILVSEDTRNQGGGFVYRELDMVRVKGKERPVRIFAVLGREGQVSPATLAVTAAFEQALGYYRNSAWDAAEKILQSLETNDTDTALFRLFLQRISLCRKQPPGKDWDGVFTFDAK